MRTTLNVDDRLVTRAKQVARRDGVTLTEIIERALAQYLRPQPRAAGTFKLKLLIKQGKAVSGLDLDDRDALYEKMDGRC